MIRVKIERHMRFLLDGLGHYPHANTGLKCIVMKNHFLDWLYFGHHIFGSSGPIARAKHIKLHIKKRP